LLNNEKNVLKTKQTKTLEFILQNWVRLFFVIQRKQKVIGNKTKSHNQIEVYLNRIIGQNKLYIYLAGIKTIDWTI
jgi:hypothetical protein